MMNFVVFMGTVLRWAKAFDSGESCLKDGTNSGKPMTSINETNIEDVKALVKEDAGFH